MASVEVFGLDDLNEFFSLCENIPFTVVSKALNSMAREAQLAVVKTGLAYGVLDPATPANVLDRVVYTKPKKNKDGGGYVAVTFHGVRIRGNTLTKDSRIAFENEYGNRHQAARPFVRVAATQYGPQIAAAGEAVFDEWIEKLIQSK